MADFLPFLFLTNNPVRFDFRGRSAFGKSNIPARNRQQHSNALLQQLTQTVSNLTATKTMRENDNLPNRKGNYLRFEGRASYDLVTEQLENNEQDIRLLNVKETGESLAEKLLIQ